MEELIHRFSRYTFLAFYDGGGGVSINLAPPFLKVPTVFAVQEHRPACGLVICLLIASRELW
jgi:hypothetical protein